MHEEDLASLIKSTATRVRMRDFAWSLAISAGAAIAILAFILTQGVAAPWWLPVAAFVAFASALGVRYRFSSDRDWAGPVERAVTTELGAAQAELQKLRMVRDVAEALPEPLFILDGNGLIELANPAAEEFVASEDLEGRHFAAVLRAPDVFDEAEKVITGAPPHAVDFTTLGDVVRSCRAFVAPLEDNSGTRRVLVFVRDLTSERRVEQMRADFIASASHELRTPLASLIGYIDTLRGNARDDAVAREKFLKIMQSQAERMQRLVVDLMSLSRIELNEHVPPNETLALDGAVLDVLDALAPLVRESEGDVTFIRDDEDETPIFVTGDRDEIVQAIQNLTHNAVKYGGDPPRVDVHVGRGAAPVLKAGDGAGAQAVHRVGDAAPHLAARQSIPVSELAYVQVRDYGPGIARGDLPRLTERFYRVNVERSRKRGGTGLGLAIVKHTMNRHKGGFQIESQLATGTAFTCYFRTSDVLLGEERAVGAEILRT